MGNCLCNNDRKNSYSSTPSLNDEKKNKLVKQDPTPSNQTNDQIKKDTNNQQPVELPQTITTNNNNNNNNNDNNNNNNNKPKYNFSFVASDHIIQDIYKIFQIEKELGHGASCRVLKVFHKDDPEKKYAMKEMKKDDKWNPMLFEQEVIILKKLVGHPNILHYEDCWIDNKNFYILTSLCTGGELFDKIKELKYFSENHASDIIKIILDAIRYAHSKNIVHRDLKPENVVFKDKNHEELVIIDFGDAKEVQEGSKYEDFVGTAFYLSPEAIRARTGEEIKKSDMWTIGAITYVLVTGRPPFWGRENKEIIKKIIRGQVRFPSSIRLSNECKNFILSLLIKEPKDRLSAEQALQHPWITKQKLVNNNSNEDDEEEEEEGGGGGREEKEGNIFTNLATFGTSSKLKQLIVKTVSANLDKKHHLEYERQFNLLDIKRDNQIDYEELTAFLMKGGIDQNTAEQRAINTIKHISGVHQRTISKEDWNYSNVAKLLSRDHLIERQYKKLDVDEDGFISTNDLMLIFEGATKEEINQIISEIDLDDDGVINFQEFKRAMVFEPAYIITPSENRL